MSYFVVISIIFLGFFPNFHVSWESVTTFEKAENKFVKEMENRYKRIHKWETELSEINEHLNIKDLVTLQWYNVIWLVKTSIVQLYYRIKREFVKWKIKSAKKEVKKDSLEKLIVDVPKEVDVCEHAMNFKYFKEKGWTYSKSVDNKGPQSCEIEVIANDKTYERSCVICVVNTGENLLNVRISAGDSFKWKHAFAIYLFKTYRVTTSYYIFTKREYKVEAHIHD